jgi:beta-phosphoglucomutase-like phosphatase (HAD superfamily)
MLDPVIEAVVFDLDGVIVDSEHVWDAARESLARASAAGTGTRTRSGT